MIERISITYSLKDGTTARLYEEERLFKDCCLSTLDSQLKYSGTAQSPQHLSTPHNHNSSAQSGKCLDSETH